MSNPVDLNPSTALPADAWPESADPSTGATNAPSVTLGLASSAAVSAGGTYTEVGPPSKSRKTPAIPVAVRLHASQTRPAVVLDGDDWMGFDLFAARKPGGSSSTTLVVPPEFKVYENLFVSGVNNQADFDLALELLAKLSPTFQTIVDLYRANPVPVQFGQPVGHSAVFRKGERAVKRTQTYADEIFLEKNVNLFVVLHEITHAVPLASDEEAEGIKDPLAEKYVVDPATGRRTKDPLGRRFVINPITGKQMTYAKKSRFPEGDPLYNLHLSFNEYDIGGMDDERDPVTGVIKKTPRIKKMSLIDIFTHFVGRFVRDEAVSGLAEVLLLKSLRDHGFQIPVYSPHVEEGLQILLENADRSSGGQLDVSGRYTSTAYDSDPAAPRVAFFNYDSFLGDNHFLLYNLRGLFFLAQQVKEDPERLKELKINDRLEAHGFDFASGKVDPSSFDSVDPMGIFRDLKKYLEKTLPSGNPLLPMQARLRRYLSSSSLARTFFDLSIGAPSQFALKGNFQAEYGARPTPSPAGAPERIEAQATETQQRVILSGSYVDYLERLYSFSSGEIRANLEAYLRYAERCPPDFAPKVYSRLEQILFAAAIEPEDAFLFAHSCLMSGYKGIAEQLLIKALCLPGKQAPVSDNLVKFPKKQIRPVGRWDTKWNEVVSHLMKNGRHDIVRLIVVGVDKGKEEARRAYKKEVLAVVRTYFHLEGAGYWSLRALLDSYKDCVVPTGVVIGHLRRLMAEEKAYSRMQRGLKVLGKLGGEIEDAVYTTDDLVEAERMDCRGQLSQINEEFEEKLSVSLDLRKVIIHSAGDPAVTEIPRWFTKEMELWYRHALKESEGRKDFFSKEFSAVPSHFDELVRKVHRGHGRADDRRRATVYDEEGASKFYGEILNYEEVFLGKQVLLLEALMEAPAWTKWCLKEIGELPDSQTRLNLLEAFWKKRSKDLSADEQAAFLRQWRGLIDALTAGLIGWNYIEDPSLRSFSKSDKRLPQDARNSHFYHERMIRYAHLLLKSGDPERREEGKSVLEGITHESGVAREFYTQIPYRGFLTYQSRPSFYREYASGHGRVAALLLLAEEFPAEAPRYLKEAEEILVRHPARPQSEYALVTGHEVYLLGLTAEGWAKNGFFRRGQKLWQVGRRRLSAMTEHLRTLPEPSVIPADARPVTDEDREKYGIPRDRKREVVYVVPFENMEKRSPAEEYKKLKETEKDLLILAPVRIFCNKADGLTGDEERELDAILERLHYDIHERNWYYPLSTTIGVARALCASERLKDKGIRVFSLAIYGLALIRGASETFERDGHALARTIWDAPLTEAVKDELFADLIDRLFPEDRRDLWGQTFDISFLTGDEKEPGLFHQIFETDRLPKSEKALLGKFMKIREELTFDRTLKPEDRGRRLHVWTEIFMHVAQKGEILDPQNYARLLALAPHDPLYTASLGFLHPIQALADQDQKKEKLLPRPADVLQGNYDVDAAYELLEARLADLMDDDGSLEELRAMTPLITALYQREVRTAGELTIFVHFRQLAVLKLCLPFLKEPLSGERPPTEKERVLIEALFNQEDREIAHAGVPFYEHYFKNPEIDLSIRRICFEGLVRGGKYSSYVASHHQLVSEKGPDSALKRFYDRLVAWERITKRLDDFSISLLLEKSADEAAVLLMKYEEVKWKVDELRALYKNWEEEEIRARSARRKISSRDPLDFDAMELEFYAIYLPRRKEDAEERVRQIKVDAPLDDHESEWLDYYANLIRGIAIKSNKDRDQFSRALSLLIPDLPPSWERDFLKLFDGLYLSEDDLKGQLESLIEKYGEYLEEEGAGGDNLVEDIYGENEFNWESKGRRGYLDEEDDIDEDSISMQLRRVGIDGPQLLEDLLNLYEQYSLNRLEGTINSTVFRILPNASRKNLKASRWDRTAIGFHLDRFDFKTGRDAADLLNRLRQMMPQELRARSYRKDRVKINQIEMPVIFRNRPPLTQFLLLRHFLEMPVGEQKDLVEQLEELDEDQSVRRFFELTGLQKVGQFLSIWPEVPEKHREELRGFQDKVAPSDLQDVKDTIADELDPVRAKELIDMIDPVPLNAGTIGEVYLLKKDGEITGVLKVIPQSKRTKIETMLRRFYHILNLLEMYRDKMEGASTAVRVIRQLIATIEMETDFQLEIKGAGEFKTALGRLGGDYAKKIRVPDYNREYTSPSVLVMSFEKGTKITEVEDKQLAQEAGEYLDNLLNQMVLNSDLYPDDLHPGNILVDEETGQIVLLDFGRLGRLNADRREIIQTFIATAFGNEPTALLEVMEQMEAPNARRTGYDREGLLRRVRELAGEAIGADPFDVLSKLLNAAGEYGLEIDLAYIQVLKAKMTMAGTLHSIRHPKNGNGKNGSSKDPNLIGGKDSMALELPDPPAPWSEKEADLPPALHNPPRSPLILRGEDQGVEFVSEPTEASAGDAEEVQEWNAELAEVDEEIPEGYEEAPDHLAYAGLDGYSNSSGLLPSVAVFGAAGMPAIAPALRSALLVR